jgi:hypothetical protein
MPHPRLRILAALLVIACPAPAFAERWVRIVADDMPEIDMDAIRREGRWTYYSVRWHAGSVSQFRVDCSQRGNIDLESYSGGVWVRSTIDYEYPQVEVACGRRRPGLASEW